jgi:hypothetical protein
MTTAMNGKISIYAMGDVLLDLEGKDSGSDHCSLPLDTSP